MTSTPSRLVAVLFADICGYTRQMGKDEFGTLEKLESLHKIVADTIGRNSGRLVKTIGDGFMAEFMSAFSAVECGLEILTYLKEQESIQGANRFDLRIGVQAGDVVDKDGDLFGATVNLAARLEETAPPGTICVTEPTLLICQQKVLARAESLGVPTLKNVEHPLRLYALRPAEEPLNDSAIPRRRFRKARRRKRIRWAAIVSAPVAAALAFILLQPHRAKVLPTNSTVSALHFGFLSHASESFQNTEIKSIVDALQQKWSDRVESIRLGNVAEAEEKLKAGSLDFAMISPFAYVKLVESWPSVRLLAKVSYEGTDAYQGIIAVRMKSKIVELGDLKGKVICWVSKTSTTGYLMPRWLLRHNGLDPETLFSSVVYSGDHLSSLRYLQDRSCDAAAVYAEALHSGREKGIIPSSFRILVATPPIPSKAIVARNSLDRKVINQVLETLLSLQIGKGDPSAENVAYTRLTGFKSARDSDYDVIRTILHDEPVAIAMKDSDRETDYPAAR